VSSILPSAVNELIEVLSKLPGVGPKMASRLAFYLLQKGKDDINQITDAILGITQSLRQCQKCGLIAENDLCPICQSQTRNEHQICVVEDSLDVVAFERANSYQGVYHVLGGVLSPIDGIGPEQLRIEQLMARLVEHQECEIILALNPSLEGEATADYLKDEIMKVNSSAVVTQIARGLPMGSDVEYADPTTLVRALEGRKEF